MQIVCSGMCSDLWFSGLCALACYGLRRLVVVAGGLFFLWLGWRRFLLFAVIGFWCGFYSLFGDLGFAGYCGFWLVGLVDGGLWVV